MEDAGLLDEAVSVIRSFTLSRELGSKDGGDNDDESSQHSGITSVNITTKQLPSKPQPSSRKSRHKRQEDELVSTDLGLNLDEEPSLVFSQMRINNDFKDSQTLSQVIRVNQEQMKAVVLKGEPVMNRTNKMNAWKDKKHMMKYGSTAIDVLPTDVMFKIKNQSIVRNALDEYASLSPKWYSNIKADRPLALKARKKTIYSFEDKCSGQKIQPVFKAHRVQSEKDV